MFYTALISIHHCSNDGNNNRFITVDICWNYVFLLILVCRSRVTPMALRSSWVPVTGDPRDAMVRLNAGHRWPPWRHGQVECRSPVTPTALRPSWVPVIDKTPTAPRPSWVRAIGDPHGVHVFMDYGKEHNRNGTISNHK